MFYLTLPFIFLRFWFIEAPVSLMNFFFSLNNALLQLLSFPLMIKTYFRPWKNEYREGLVAFSIGMGMFIKTFVILAEAILFIVILVSEISFLLAFIVMPIIALALIFNI